MTFYISVHEYGAHNYYHLQQDVDGIIADIQKKNEQLKSITTSSPAMRAVNVRGLFGYSINMSFCSYMYVCYRVRFF